jgi:putative addiction module antidote
LNVTLDCVIHLYNGVRHEREFQSGAGTLQVRKIGNSIGFILPKDTAARFDLKEGDKLFLVEQPGGGFVLTPHDPDFEKAMAVARRGMKRYHNALAELAK